MMRKTFLLAAWAASAILAGCGGGSEPAGSAQSGADLIAAQVRGERGRLLEAPEEVASFTAAAIDAGTLAAGLQSLTGPAQCDVRVVGIHYVTSGVQGEEADASGVLMVPAGACAGRKFRLLAYGKRTDVEKPRTMANPADPEVFELMAMYAARGYALVASDYLGFAKSAYTYHPFLHADSEATTLADAIRAARKAMARLDQIPPSEVLLAGYSQGGHVSAATQRLVEQRHSNEIRIVGAAHLAAPVNLSGALQLQEAIVAYQFFIPYALTSWNKVYGNVYADPANAIEVFKAPYATYIDGLLPSVTLDYDTLLSSGALPDGTPEQVRDALMQPTFLAALHANPQHPVRQDAARNDLLGWNPKAPTLMCSGAGDPTVPMAVHQAVAMADFASRGLANVTAVDVDAYVQATFAPGGVAPTNPMTAEYWTYFGNYHGKYERIFCDAAARAFFDGLLQ